MMSFQAVGILGLPLELPDWYATCDKLDVTNQQRQLFLRSYDITQLSRDCCWRGPMDPDYSRDQVKQELEETRSKFLHLKPLDWMRYSDFTEALEKPEYKHLAPLTITTSTQICVAEDDSVRDMFEDFEPEPAPVVKSVPQPNDISGSDREMADAV